MEPPPPQDATATANAATAHAAASAARQRERERQHIAQLEREVQQLKDMLLCSERAADMAQKPLLKQLDALQEENEKLKHDSNALVQTWERTLGDLFGQLGVLAARSQVGSDDNDNDDDEEEMEVEMEIVVDSSNDDEVEQMEQVKREAPRGMANAPALQEQQARAMDDGDRELASKIEILQKKYEDLRQELSKTQLKLHLDTPACEAGLGGFQIARASGKVAASTGAAIAHSELTANSSAEVLPSTEETVLNSWSSDTQDDHEEGRASPFCTEEMVAQLQFVMYQYDASRSEIDEMEELQFNTQAQVFKRHFELQQKQKAWGSLDVRSDKRVFFRPGLRRQAVLKEKKFHDQSSADGMINGDGDWYKGRQEYFSDIYRQFVQDEAKHKQALMQMHLEKNSPFSKLPVLANRFVLQRLRGKGGSGEVWDVIDYADSRRWCALKLAASQKRAQREHYTHSRLCHPNIVRVGDSAFTIDYRQQNYTIFTIESMESDLHQLIEIHQKFNEHWALGVLFHLLNALTYLHRDMKIAHYDIKPTNILVGADDHVKLTDFDLARNVDEPIASAAIGTRRFLPPECFRACFAQNAGTAEKADIWMVGVVYCLMLWGKHPVVSDKASAAEVDLVLARYNGSLQYPPDVSELSRWIIQGCLHPDPRCRPSAFQLLQGLQHVTKP